MFEGDDVSALGSDMKVTADTTGKTSGAKSV